MKLTKEYLEKVIKEEITNIFEQPEEQGAAPVGAEDKAAKRAGQSAVKLADEFVNAMVDKASSLGPRLKQLKANPTKKLALARSLLVNVVEMDPAMIDKMITQLTAGTKG